jgi:organic radical activating enzyme
MMLPKNGCAYPFKAAMMMHGTPTTPCCRFHDRFLSEADKNPDDLFRDIRDTMMRNEWHEGCFKCKADEDAGKTSMRTEADEFFDDFTDNLELQYLEITVGRLCNLACVSCGLEFSHTWDKDSIALDYPNTYKIEHFKKKENSELNLDDLDIQRLKNVRFMKVTGGEPFLHRQFLNLIVRLAESGLSKNIEIEIFTNSTWYPKKVDEDALLTFKKVTITASIDGYGEVNDLLRYPAKWDVVESTLDKWIEMRDNNKDKVEVMIACTISVINAPQMLEFMVWARSEKYCPVILQTVYEPHYLSISHWPDWFKKGLEYTVDSQFSFDTKKFPYEKRKKPHQLVKKLCKRTGANHDDSEDFLIEMNRLFELRGQSIDMAPQFKKIIETFKP